MYRATAGDRTVWIDEAAHRAGNLQHIATNLQWLADRGKIDIVRSPETIRRANALVKAYRSLDIPDSGGPRCYVQELKDIAYGLVAIYSNPAGSVALLLDLQPLMLQHNERRALLLLTSELVMNAMRHAFAGRCSGSIRISLHWDQECEEGMLSVADDGKGPDDIAAKPGHGCGIIRRLAIVLDGAATWRRSTLTGGTEAVVRFPLPAPLFELLPDEPTSIPGGNPGKT